jgi:hypothetical protein
MGEEDLLMQMDMCLKESGKTIKNMAMVNRHT